MSRLFLLIVVGFVLSMGAYSFADDSECICISKFYPYNVTGTGRKGTCSGYQRGPFCLGDGGKCPCFTEFQLRNGFKNTSTETLGQLCTRDTDRDLLDPPEDFRDVFIVKSPGDIFYARVSRTDDSGDNQFATCQFNPTDSNDPGFLNNGEFITLEEADICIDLILAFEQDASLNGCL